MNKTLLFLSASLFSTSLMASEFHTKEEEIGNKSSSTCPDKENDAEQSQRAPSKRPTLKRQNAFSPDTSRRMPEIAGALELIRARKASSSTSSQQNPQ